MAAVLVAACGGGGGTPREAPQARAAEAPGATAAEGVIREALASANGASLRLVTPQALDEASRLASQATFGASEALLQDIRALGPAAWVAQQMTLSNSSYTSGGGSGITTVTDVDFCSRPANEGPYCWRDNYSTEPLQWDFYRNAVMKPDQLRQRVAFALGQIVVISGYEVAGTYGFRRYHNHLLDNAFGNYREVLKKVARSPMMGEYLDHVNNDRYAPNENFPRELLQLFTIGTCELRPNGTLKGGACQPTYDNTTVREYAFALTGWTYAPGGSTPWGCWPEGANCAFYGAEMVAAGSPLRDREQRRLLGGVVVPANTGASAALELVLDSLMNHPNMAPFIGKRLIQFLVSSNPSGGYVERVAAAFTAGSFSAGGRSFGTGQRGDLAATVAAILLDEEARVKTPKKGGHLKEPVLLFTGVLRALNGVTDGEPLGWWWGETLRQRIFNSPSVFNYYQPDYPVPGTPLVGPEFGIHNVNSALERFNYLTYLLEWGGSDPWADIPNATGTRVNLAAWLPLAETPGTLVDNLSLLAIGRPLPAAARQKVIEAVSYWTSQTDATNWRERRVAMAAWLVFASPMYQVQR
jgi:uncharacterized protein (DUF1800 family)